MTDYVRRAVYYAPPAESELWRFGCAWLGWDAEAGEPVPHPKVEGLPAAPEALTADPRRYGFHGTLKPPFAMAADRTVEEFDAAVEALAARRAPFDAPPLRLHAEGRFASLRPSEPSRELQALADACVRDLDGFRARPDAAELERRRSANLTPTQDAHLVTWGYPYVLDQFRFHLTLTSALSPEPLARTAKALQPHAAPLCRDPLPVHEIAVFGDPGGGAPFRLLRRLSLGG